MKRLLRFTFCFFFCAVLTSSTILTSFAKVKAVTYFGDEWPVNFLSSEHAQAEEDFERIREDGFNTLIYMVPWREIQPEADGGFNEEAIAKLDSMVSRAEKAGLGVYVRLGYLWDYGEGMDRATMYKGVFTDATIRRNWLNYAARMYQVLSVHSNYRGAFITWEDFWPYLGTLCETYDEMDDKLMQLLSDTQKVYPELSMECRLHSEYYDDAWHGHEKTFACADAPYSAAMLAVSMGLPDDMQIPTDLALNQSTVMIEKIEAAGKPVFIDQFLYMETTPGYEQLAVPEDINAYLSGMGKVFDQHTIGYGIWTYKDYADNIVANPEFGQGDRYWTLSSASVETVDGNAKAIIEAGGSIAQDMTGGGFSGSNCTKVRIKADSETAGTLTVDVGGYTETAVLSPGTQTLEITYPVQCKDSLKITSSVRVYVDNIKVYANITSGEIYGIDDTPGPYLKGIRALNANLH